VVAAVEAEAELDVLGLAAVVAACEMR